MGIGGVACPKPESLRKAKARKDRREASVKKSVRAECVARDGDCRICDWENNPDDIHDDDLPMPSEFELNPSEWAHLEDSRRARTRKMRPELRHHTSGSCMMCRFHHALYDNRELHVRFQTNLGADGPMEFYR